MSASALDADYPWLQEHLRDLAHDKPQMAQHQEMVDAGLVYPHDIENPAGCWVELVHACRIQDHNTRKQNALKWMALARGSIWTRDMLMKLDFVDDSSGEEPEVEYGGPFQDTTDPHTVKALLDAADAISSKEEALGAPVDLDEDSEPMTEPFMED